eukprot:scaffold9715_cov113-Isochrysis_galbana.AAC.8
MCPTLNRDNEGVPIPCARRPVRPLARRPAWLQRYALRPAPWPLALLPPPPGGVPRGCLGAFRLGGGPPVRHPGSAQGHGLRGERHPAATAFAPTVAQSPTDRRQGHPGRAGVRVGAEPRRASLRAAGHLRLRQPGAAHPADAKGQGRAAVRGARDCGRSHARVPHQPGGL